jgi:DNA (cytosine-5)-methyltransferase 1
MEPQQHPRRYTVAELFCGCGGFSRGFSRSGRFQVVFGNDIKRAALRTFQFNHRESPGPPPAIEKDIRAVTTEDITRAISRTAAGEWGLDCLIGGPPCQGFSQMRRSEERNDNEIVRFKGYDRLDQDPRNDLVLRLLEVVNDLRPRFVVIENVPQMRAHAHNGRPGALLGSVQELLGDMGYDARAGILNAANYGVPQLRERLVILASRVCAASLPPPTHSEFPEPVDSQVLPFPGLSGHRMLPWVTVEEAIGDLPDPALGPIDKLGGGPPSLYPPTGLSPYAFELRSTACFPYNHITRRYSQDILATIKEMRPGETWDCASQRKREEYEEVIADLVRLGISRTEAVQTLTEQGKINGKFLKRYYWSAYTRLAWNRPALTITANANFLGSGRFTHPEKDRGITMREAARLQSFDDDFRFITSASDDSDTSAIGVGLDMIGEAVPPKLAETLARHIAFLLDNRAAMRATKEPAIEVAPSVGQSAQL